MDVYTLGRVLLPVVVGLLGLSVVVAVLTGIFAVVKFLAVWRQVIQKLDAPRQFEVTIHLNTGEKTSQPPMQDQT